MSYESLTDEEIGYLLKMSKRITNTNVKQKRKAAHLELNYDVVSSCDLYHFYLYTRQSVPDKDDFSCGLMWKGSNSKLNSNVTLIRYNGSSHIHSNFLENEEISQRCHIHRATQRYIQANKKPERYAQATDRYQNLKGAIRCLLQDCNVSGLNTVFQGDLLECPSP